MLPAANGRPDGNAGAGAAGPRLSVQAIVAAFGCDERTVAAWRAKAGAHCQPVLTASRYLVGCASNLCWYHDSLRLATAEVERAQIKHAGVMPARRAVLDEYAAQEPPKHMKMVLRAAETCQLLPTTPWWTEASQTARPILDELWDGGRSAAAAAQAIKRLVDEVIQQPFSFQ